MNPRDKLFYNILQEFEYQLVNDLVKPVLKHKTILELFLMIEEGLKIIDEEDPNEGDNGSLIDQYPELFQEDYQ